MPHSPSSHHRSRIDDVFHDTGALASMQQGNVFMIHAVVHVEAAISVLQVHLQVCPALTHTMRIFVPCTINAT